MDVTHTKVRRQRRRGVYRLPISASGSAKWLCNKRDGLTAQAQKRRQRGKHRVALAPEDLLAAAAAERPHADSDGLTSGWGGDGLCDEAFKQFVHECKEDINGSKECSNGDRMSVQRSTLQSDVGSSSGCEKYELGRESDVEQDSQETERDSVLRFSSVKLNGCEEFLKVPEAGVNGLTDLRYNGDLQLSNSVVTGSEQNRDAVLTDIGSEEESSVAESAAEHTTSSDDFTRDDKVCPTPLSQVYQDDPEQSQERDVNTGLISDVTDSTLNITQLYECCSPDFVQKSYIGIAEDRKDIVLDHTQEEESWGKSTTPEQKCNLLEVNGEQKCSISGVSSAVENFVDQFAPIHIKTENTNSTFEEIQSTQEYVLLEEDEGEVVLTLAVGDGGQLVQTVDGQSPQLPPGLASQLAASSCLGAAADSGAGAPRGDGGGGGGGGDGGGLHEQEASLLLSDADLVLAGEAIQEALDGLSSSPPPVVRTPAALTRLLNNLSLQDTQQQQRREERLHFGDVEEALDAIEGDGTPRRPRLRHHPRQLHFRADTPKPAELPIKMGPGVHKEVERAARALFSKRTRTLYHWMYPDTPKRKLKATVASAWDTLPESEKLIYMSQVMGRFGTPASNLMVNPQLVGMSADQLETECAVAGLLAAEAEAAEAAGADHLPLPCGGNPCRAARKRAQLALLPAFHGKRPRGAQEQPLFSDTELDPCKQDTDDEISTDELFAPLGI